MKLFILALFSVALISATFVDDSMEDSRDESYISRQEFSLDKLRNLKITREAESLNGQRLVDYINENQDLWTARLNAKFNAMDDDVKRGMMGVKHVGNSAKAMQKLGKTRFLDIQLPQNFDARQNWPNCQSIGAIRDQSSCGSCWAFGAVEAMSDRICIASGGKIQVSLSADDLLSCCTACGFGCEGGEPEEAWHFWVDKGIVTGSNYTQQQGCKPYPFPPCEHHSPKTHFQPCKHDLYPTPKCEQKCQATYTTRAYGEDKYYGKTSYAVHQSVQAIQNELYTNGPIEITFNVYADFLNYVGGIYFHRAGGFMGGHAVKLVGWGVENGVDYWLVANSWNRDFGEDGLFRIVRGKNECGIESGGVAGVADLQRSPSANEFAHPPHRHHSHRRVRVEDSDDF
jgi:cathepsin B